MALEMSYKFTKKIQTESVKLKGGEAQDDYITGIYGKIYLTDSDTGESVCRDSFWKMTEPSDKNKSDLIDLDKVSSVPDSAKTKAEAEISSSVLIAQMTKDLEEKKKQAKQSVVEWSGDFA